MLDDHSVIARNGKVLGRATYEVPLRARLMAVERSPRCSFRESIGPWCPMITAHIWVVAQPVLLIGKKVHGATVHDTVTVVNASTGRAPKPVPGDGHYMVASGSRRGAPVFAPGLSMAFTNGN